MMNTMLCTGMLLLWQCNGVAACSGQQSWDGGPGINNYHDNSDCFWAGQCSDSSMSVVLHFTEFDLESNFDHVRVYDGTSSSAPLVGDFSGHRIPSDVHLSGSHAYVVLTSDGSVGGDGFQSTASCTPSYNSNTCRYAHDGECDEPRYCARGTDCSDCYTCGNGHRLLLSDATRPTGQNAYDVNLGKKEPPLKIDVKDQMNDDRDDGVEGHGVDGIILNTYDVNLGKKEPPLTIDAKDQMNEDRDDDAEGRGVDGIIL